MRLSALVRWAAALPALLIALAAQAQQSCPLPLTTPDGAFADAGSGSGMVRHLPTGLVWKRCAEGQAWDGATCTGTAAGYAWQQAFARVDAVNQAAAGTQNLGATDWRLPNLNELTSIAELGCAEPAINLAQFPGTGANWAFWSSSPIVTRPNLAWAVFLVNGNDTSSGRTATNYVRLVRGGQSFLDYVDAPAVAPTLTGTAPGGTVGQPYAGFTPTLGPAGVTQPVTYALAGGTLPPGLSLNPTTGHISGTPTAAGSYDFSLVASNAAGDSAPLAQTVVIAAMAVAPTLTGTAPGGTVGQPYAGFTPTLGPAGVTQPVTYALAGGTLPPGLSLNPATGQISGTPTAAGSYDFSLVASNAAGDSAPLALRLVVAATGNGNGNGTGGGAGGGGQVTAVPTLGQWTLVWLGLAAALLGARRLRRG